VAAGPLLRGDAALSKVGADARDNYSVVEWLELRNFIGVSNGGVSAHGGGRKILFQGLLIHDFFGAFTTTGIRSRTGASTVPVSFTVRNCVIYNGDTAGIFNGDCDADITVQNSTIFNIHNVTTSRGVFIGSSGGTMTVTNTISMNSLPDFGSSGGSMTQFNNVSSDATAAGTLPLINKVAANQFVSVTPTSEDLHLRAGADAIDTGTNLLATARFADDIDGQGRPGGAAWDMGADELNGTTPVKLALFGALGLDSAVFVEWGTGSELDNLGFHLYRAVSEDGPWTRLNSNLIPGLGSSAVAEYTTKGEKNFLSKIEFTPAKGGD
jgi:hypothetical protein